MGYMAETYGFYSHSEAEDSELARWFGLLDLLFVPRVVLEATHTAGKGLQEYSGDDVGDPSNPDYSDGSESHLNGKFICHPSEGAAMPDA